MTVLDKVALIVLESGSDLMLRQIAEREYDADYDYAGCLEHCIAESLRRIPKHVARFATCPESGGASAAKLMDDARNEWEELKTHLRTHHIAALWQSRIEQGAHLYIRAVKLTA